MEEVLIANQIVCSMKVMLNTVCIYFSNSIRLRIAGKQLIYGIRSSTVIRHLEDDEQKDVFYGCLS